MKHPPFNYDIGNEVDVILARLGPDIEAFRDKKILVTGGTGFFGRWLLQVLCTLIEKHKFKLEIYVVSRNPKLFLKNHSNYPFFKHINFLSGDIRNFELPKIKLDYLFHMATTSATETYSDHDQLQKIRLLYEGTEHVLKKSGAAGVENVLFTSSGVTYGPLTGNGSKYHEYDLSAPCTLNAGSALGEGKRLAEYLVAYYAGEFNYKFNIARCFSFAGQFLPTNIHYAFGNFILDAMNGSYIKINGSGRELRSYLYIGDAIVWLMKALIYPKNEIYNIGSSKEISIKGLAEAIAFEFGNTVEVEVLGKTSAADNFTRKIYVPNNEKAKRDLDVDEWTSLDEMIRKMKEKI